MRKDKLIFKFLLPIRIILSIIFVFIIILFFNFIHEMGHILACWYLGIDKTTLTINKDFGMTVHYFDDVTKNEERFITLSGSGFAIIIAFILWCYGIKYRNYTFLFSGYLVIICNLFYWILGASNNLYDARNFMDTYSEFNPNFIIIPCLFIIIIHTGITYTIFIKRLLNYHIRMEVKI